MKTHLVEVSEQKTDKCFRRDSMKKTIMQITDYCIKGLEKQVGYRVCIDDLSIMNEVDELDVCEIIMDIEKEHGITFSQDISYIYDSVTQFIETLYNAQEE